MEAYERQAHKYEIRFCNQQIEHTHPAVPSVVARLYVEKRTRHMEALAAERLLARSAQVITLPVPVEPAVTNPEVIAA